MSINMKYLSVIGLFLVLGMLATANPVIAVVTTVTSSPLKKNIPQKQTSSVLIRWQLNLTTPVSPITSSQGLFTDPMGRVLRIVTKPLVKSVSATATSTTIRETVLVPSDLIVIAQKMGFNQVRYTRSFVDPATSVPSGATINLNMAGGITGPLSISRVQLRFDNGSPIQTIGKGETTRVFADILFSGSGKFKAVWELADPSSTGGVPIFNKIKLLSRRLVGAKKVTLQSPELPATRTGLHLLRLRVLEPSIGFDPPLVQYYVQDQGEGDVKHSINLLSPKSGKNLTAATEFKWKAIPGTRAYQLQIFPQDSSAVGGNQSVSVGANQMTSVGSEAPSGPPVAGAMVPGKQTRLTLKNLNANQLEKGRTYYWRIVAMAPNGLVLGQSSLRPIHVPKPKR